MRRMRNVAMRRRRRDDNDVVVVVGKKRARKTRLQAFVESKQKDKLSQTLVELRARRAEWGLDEVFGSDNADDLALVRARYLLFVPGLSPTAVGEYLGHPSNSAVRRCYCKLFFDDRERMCFIDALRSFLYVFHLPGEGQMIDRVVEAFAHAAFENVREHRLFGSKDVPYLLSYSLIMLNTDLHQSGGKRVQPPMTREDFLKNNRFYSKDINGEKRLPDDFLSELYANIRDRPLDSVAFRSLHSGDGVAAAADTSDALTLEMWRDATYRCSVATTSSKRAAYDETDVHMSVFPVLCASAPCPLFSTLISRWSSRSGGRPNSDGRTRIRICA